MLAPRITVPVAASPATPLRPEPSDLGRDLLAALHDRQRVWQAGADTPGSDLCEEPYISQIEAVEERIADLCAEIAARPVRTLSDMLDHAIAASDACHVHTSGVVAYHPGVNAMRDAIVAMLAAGGLDLKAWLDVERDGREVA
jgi:hypothetical protein